ncbi:hypothetical protein SAMN04489727_2021 [Amycolatopsis tolypomycina]|uniref:Uncharacterized protein n=1 Tax=Amycolatopsis tolypomycina TaxID=208445 RepID=A0A1H4JLN0_9PSEU|nr:hypothetical protein SAMN04489727_2021 [Amycolatopsis tolypomycina]
MRNFADFPDLANVYYFEDSSTLGIDRSEMR